MSGVEPQGLVVTRVGQPYRFKGWKSEGSKWVSEAQAASAMFMDRELWSVGISVLLGEERVGGFVVRGECYSSRQGR